MKLKFFVMMFIFWIVWITHSNLSYQYSPEDLDGKSIFTIGLTFRIAFCVCVGALIGALYVNKVFWVIWNACLLAFILYIILIQFGYSVWPKILIPLSFSASFSTVLLIHYKWTVQSTEIAYLQKYKDTNLLICIFFSYISLYLLMSLMPSFAELPWRGQGYVLTMYIITFLSLLIMIGAYAGSFIVKMRTVTAISLVLFGAIAFYFCPYNGWHRQLIWTVALSGVYALYLVGLYYTVVNYKSSTQENDL